MQERATTFEKVYLEIDKMAGLRVALRNKQHAGSILHVRGWDQQTTPEIKGKLTDQDEKPIWEGILMTANQINDIFKPFDRNDTPRSYARRSGKLGHSRTAGVVRMETRDAITFNLVLCNGGEEPISIITSTENPEQLTLEIEVDGESLKKILFDREIHRKKIEKILE